MNVQYENCFENVLKRKLLYLSKKCEPRYNIKQYFLSFKYKRDIYEHMYILIYR